MSIYSEKFNQKLLDDKNTSIGKISNLVNPKTKKILDVGCASGYLGSYFKKKYKCEVWGIEINKNDYQKAKQKLDKVFNIDIESQKELSKIKNKFDTIIFADVLEHLKDPLFCLKNFQNKLNLDGEIIASIPNIANYRTKLMLFNGNWEYEDFGLMDKTHKTFFTYDSIVDLFEKSGLYIYELSYTRSNVSTPDLLNMLKKSGIEINQTIINNFFSIESDIFQYIIKAKTTKPEKSINYLEGKDETIHKLFSSPQDIIKTEKDIGLNLIQENKEIKKELDKIKFSKTFIYWQKFNKIKKKLFKK